MNNNNNKNDKHITHKYYLSLAYHFDFNKQQTFFSFQVSIGDN
jgi:hypothetical protein